MPNSAVMRAQAILYLRRHNAEFDPTVRSTSIVKSASCSLKAFIEERT